MKIDIKKINEFRKEMMGKYYKSIGLNDINRINKQNNVYIAYCFVGIAVVSVIETLTKKVMLIDEFVIDKKNRCNGYGTILMEFIIYFAKKKKVDCIELCTKDSNKTAQKFYKGLGFKDRKNMTLRMWL
jgi:GNAT superfamily N-acetyltransferase